MTLWFWLGSCFLYLTYLQGHIDRKKIVLKTLLVSLVKARNKFWFTVYFTSAPKVMFWTICKKPKPFEVAIETLLIWYDYFLELANLQKRTIRLQMQLHKRFDYCTSANSFRIMVICYFMNWIVTAETIKEGKLFAEIRYLYCVMSQL